VEGEIKMNRERETVIAIREAIEEGRLKEPFRPDDVNRVINGSFAGRFLSRHRVGNPGHRGKKYNEHFIRLAPGLYRLKKEIDLQP
jgi:hypothetical protein